MNDDLTLLRRYVDERSEDAFRRLFDKHRTLVYSTCLRDIGDRDLAEDAALAVFVILARKARHLKRYRSLAGWLYLTARLTSRDIVKRELRRRDRERPLAIEAHLVDNDRWRLIESGLQHAIDSLPAVDREAVLLRFYEGLSIREVATALAISEEAAKKRVARSLDRLRRGLAGTSVAVGLVVLVTLLDEHAAIALPAGLDDAFLSMSHGLATSSLPDRLTQLSRRGLQHMQRSQLRLVAASVSLVALLAGAINTVVGHARASVDGGTATAAIVDVKNHYLSAKSFTMRIVNQDSSGLYPGHSTQRFVWTCPMNFALTLTSKRPAHMHPHMVANVGLMGNVPDDFYGQGDSVREVGPGYPQTQKRVTFNQMPGWEVSGGFIVSWLERTPVGDMFEKPMPEWPAGAHVRLDWGPRTIWHGHGVREIVATESMDPPHPVAAEIVPGSAPAKTAPRSEQNSDSVSLFIDPRSKTLVGVETREKGKVGWAEYLDQQFDPVLPVDVSVVPN